MHIGKFVFSQLLDFIISDVFRRISNRYNWNRHINRLLYDGNRAVIDRKQPSIYEMHMIASKSLLDTKQLRELFGEPNNNNVKEQERSNEPSLF